MRPLPLLAAVAAVAIVAVVTVMRPATRPVTELPQEALPAAGEQSPVAAADRVSGPDEGPVVTNANRAQGCAIVTRYMPAGDGTVTELYSCEKTMPDLRHPYEDYPDAALESLAYSDARAAEVLAYRWRYRNDPEAISLIARAAALADGDPEPIVNFTRAYLKPTTIDDVPVAKTVRVKYVLNAVTRLLGDDRHLLPYYDSLIRAHSQDPEGEIARLDEIAQEIVAEMRQVQLGVSGTSGIGG